MPEPAELHDDSPADPMLMVVATLLFGVLYHFALQLSDGFNNLPAMKLMGIGLLLFLVSLFVPDRFGLKRNRESMCLLLAGAGMLVELYFAMTAWPSDALPRLHESMLPRWHVTVLFTAIVASSCMSGRSWLGTMAPLILILFHLATTTWVIWNAPDPHIDVFTWQQEALKRLTAGVNPYLPPMPEIYGENAPNLYPPGFLSGKEVLTGIVYPPLSVLLTLPAYILFGDMRIAMAIWVAIGGALAIAARRTRLAFAGVALLFFAPRLFKVLTQAWTEPLLILAVGFVLFAALRKRALLPVAICVLISVKQYGIIFLPLTLLLVPRPWTWRTLVRFYVPPIALALVINLPFFLWDPHAFVRSTMLYHLGSPFRIDSLSALTLITQDRVVGAKWARLGIVAIPVMWALLIWRMPRSPFGFAASVGALTMVFFSLSKQGFLNYHFFAASALFLAVAAAKLEDPRQQQVNPA